MKKSDISKVLFIGLLLFGISRLLVTEGGYLERLVSSWVYPFLKLQHTLVTYLKRRRQEHLASTELVQKLIQEQHRSEDLQKELIELRALLFQLSAAHEAQKFLDRYRLDDMQSAAVLLRNFGQSHFFIVDKGSRAGVAENMSAIYKNCLVGKVSEVYPFYSKVILISDPCCKIAAFCSETGAKGIYEGTGQLDKAVLSYVNPLDKIKEGELILSSGEGLIFPRGFGIGRIASEQQDQEKYSVNIDLLDFARLDYCILIPYKSSLP